MAIQFNCPSCEAMIRVPDAAAGKKGTCPRCNEKLLVPTVSPAQSTPAVGSFPKTNPPVPEKTGLPQLELAEASGLPQLAPLTDSPLANLGSEPEPSSTDSPFGLPRLEPVAPAAVSYGSRKKTSKKGKSNFPSWLVPVVCIAGIAGFIAWSLWTSQPRLEGNLTAQVVHDLETRPGVIPGDLSGLKEDDLGEVLRHLRAEPITWSSTISKFTFTGGENGIDVTVQNASAAHFVSVKPSQNPAFVKYIAQHTDELEKARQASLEKYAPAFYAAWKKQFDKHDLVDDQIMHRDRVALPAMVAGLGFHVEAVVNGNPYQCVYEDDEGTLYFLLPNAAKSFLLTGRKVSDSLLIPAKFTVKITGSASADSSPKRRTKRKTQADREADKEGMDPDLEKSDPEMTPPDERAPVRDDEMLTNDDPDAMELKPKSLTRKKPAMMDEGEEAMDEMPAKSRPKKKAAIKN